MKNDELTLFPVTGWEVAPIPAYGAIFIRPAFLTHPLQKMEESDPGRRYLLTVEQAQDLRDAIDRTLQRLKNGEPQGTGLPKH